VRFNLLMVATCGLLLGALPARAQVRTQPAAPGSQPGTPAILQTTPNPGAAASVPGGKPAPAPAAGEKGGKERDPFRNVMPVKKVPQGLPSRLPAGKRGLVIEQLELQGIARAVDGSWIAVVDNKSKRSYFLHEKDQLYNGVVSKILPDRIIFLESSTEPGQVATHEVVKQLSSE